MKLKTIKVEREASSPGWSKWISPDPRNYIMVCCDCGLAHRLQFYATRVDKRYATGRFTYKVLNRRHFGVLFRAQRAEAYTKQARKKVRQWQPKQRSG